MANQIQIKRTSVSGRAANTTTLTNPGELALNLPDGIMYSTNGSVVFEIGANNTNAQVTGTLTVNAISANGGVGTDGQVLTSNGTTTYWSSAAGGSGGGYYYGDNGAVGDANNKVNIFRVNATTLNANVTFANGENSSAIGPLTISNGYYLTIESGARVVIV